MNEALYAEIEQEIKKDRDLLVSDTVRLINIRSVVGPSLPGAPFGEGPKKVLDAVWQMGGELGFVMKDYKCGFVSLALKEGPIDVGIFCHGDVVPEGNDWIHDPYHAVEYENCIIGRGATDNKGQLVSMLHLLTILKKLQVELPYNAALYVGSAEEVGMFDMFGIEGNPEAPGFLNVAELPKLSLVPDGAFPVAYCGMGGARVYFTSTKKLESVTIDGGHDENPGEVTATFTDGIHAPISESEPPTHSMKVNTDNMFVHLFERLLALDYVTESDKEVITYMRDVAACGHGELFGLDLKHPEMGDTVLRTLEVWTEDGCPRLFTRYRFPMGTSEEDIIGKMNRHGAMHGFTATLKQKNGVKPFNHGVDNPLVKLLCDTANEVTGEGKAPLVEVGGTYAHWLPNGFIFGMSGCKKPEGYPEGRGGAHGKDELVSIERLQRGMKIYARTLLKLRKEDFT